MGHLDRAAEHVSAHGSPSPGWEGVRGWEHAPTPHPLSACEYRANRRGRPPCRPGHTMRPVRSVRTVPSRHSARRCVHHLPEHPSTITPVLTIKWHPTAGIMAAPYLHHSGLNDGVGWCVWVGRGCMGDPGRHMPGDGPRAGSVSDAGQGRPLRMPRLARGETGYGHGVRTGPTQGRHPTGLRRVGGREGRLGSHRRTTIASRDGSNAAQCDFDRSRTDCPTARSRPI
jgi:hypothetical protein